jgi:hypothetical protein
LGRKLLAQAKMLRAAGTPAKGGGWRLQGRLPGTNLSKIDLSALELLLLRKAIGQNHDLYQWVPRSE